MAEHNDIGALGERLAKEYLVKQGFAILETNWRKGKHEVDIIAYKEGLIVFVEVKTRSSQGHGDPEDFVTIDKQRAYIRLANNYVLEKERDEEVRFDIIAIEVSQTGYQLDHIEDAFSAVGLYR